MQPLAPKASEPLSWQKRGWHMRGRIILLPRFYLLVPVHSPDTLLKPDKPLVWSRMATLAFWYSWNVIAAHVPFITQIVWSCLPVWEDSVSGTVVSSQQISCSVYQLLSLASVASHLYKPISYSCILLYTQCILFHHNYYGFVNLPRAPAKALVTLSIRKKVGKIGKLLLISCIFVDKINIKFAVFSNNSVLLAVSWHLRAHSLFKLMPAMLTAASFYNFILCHVIYHFTYKNKLIIYFYRHTALFFFFKWLPAIYPPIWTKNKNREPSSISKELLTSSSQPRKTSRLRADILEQCPAQSPSLAWQQQVS